MKNVIDLNKYKSDKEGEILIYLKERVKDESKKTAKELFSMWYVGSFVSIIVQCIIVCAVEKSFNVDFIIRSIFNLGLVALVIWTISKIFDKCVVNRLGFGKFKSEKQKLVLEKEVDMYGAMSELKYILIMNSDRTLRSHDSWINIRWNDNSSLLEFLKRSECKKFKFRLQQSNKAHYMKMVEEEKRFIKLHNEINLLSNVSKKDLRKIP